LSPAGRARLSGAAFAGMFVFGMVVALLGAILPELSRRIPLGPGGIGGLFLRMNAAMLACSLLIGLAMDRFGLKPPMAFGPLLVAAALGLIARAANDADLTPALLLLGVGGGALNGATNTLIADLHADEKRKASALNLLGVFFGVGALTLPFASGALMAAFGIERLLSSTALLCAAAGVFSLALRFPEPKQRHALPVGEMPRFLKSPLVLVMACLLFFQSGIEFTMGGYISTYLTQDLGAAQDTGAYVLAAYWAALMASRVALSRIVLRIGPHRVLLTSALLAAAGSALTAVAPSLAIAASGILLAGAALAGVYPTVLALAGNHFSRHSGTVFGILFTVALVGGMVFPWLAGQLAAAYTLRAVFALVAAGFVAELLLAAALARVAQDRATPRMTA
jgi:fucose permease